MAEIAGVDVDRAFTAVLAVGSAFAALAGVLVLPLIGASNGMDLTVTVLVFIVVIVGGVGTLSSVVLGIAKVAGILAEIKRGQTATDLALTIERDERRKVAAEAKAEVASAAAGVAQTVAFEVSQKIINGDAVQAARAYRVGFWRGARPFVDTSTMRSTSLRPSVPLARPMQSAVPQ